MPVYLAQSGEGGPVKIGMTKAGSSRLSKMQTDNAETLRVIRFLAGGRELELALHDRFHALRLRGEWFSYSDDMLGDLGAEDIEIPSQTKARPSHPLAAYLFDTGVDVTEFACISGTTAASIYRYIAGDRTPRRAILSRIVAATNGRVQPNDFFDLGQAA